MTWIEKWYNLLTSLDFWIQFLNQFIDLGPLAPILLALIESLIPALPLFAIVTFNITAYGPVLGFLYSWIGSTLGSILVFCFFRYFVKRYLSEWIARKKNLSKALAWVANRNAKTLFLMAMLPFTPSSFLNMAFGLSDFDTYTFIITLSVAKLLMMGGLAFFGNSLLLSLENPGYLILAIIIMLVLYLLSRIIRKHYDL